MKKIILLAVVVLVAINTIKAQNGSKLPTTSIENLQGKSVAANAIVNEEGPTIVSFWATWCKPCIIELNELQDVYEDWQEETNVKLLAISIDDARSAAKVPAFVNGRGWDFEVFLDKNADLKRALNVNNVPHTLLLNSDGEIVWQHAGFTPGNEELLFEELLKLEAN